MPSRKPVRTSLARSRSSPSASCALAGSARRRRERAAAAPASRSRRRSAAARCSRRTTRGTRTSRSCRCAPTPRTLDQEHQRDRWQDDAAPRLRWRRRRTASRSSSCRRSRSASRSTTPRTATRAIPGPFPIPPHAPVEGGPRATGDRHVIVVQRARVISSSSTTRSGAARTGTPTPVSTGTSRRTSCARSAGRRPTRPGLPILPGLVRYGEVTAGAIHHALRFTVEETQRGYIFPATHAASSSNNKALPPMGLRLRLKASYSLARFHGQSLVILKALKTYGMIVADNGSSWYITGAASPLERRRSRPAEDACPAAPSKP